jgi:hypothetical protein
MATIDKGFSWNRAEFLGPSHHRRLYCGQYCKALQSMDRTCTILVEYLR